MGVAIFWTMAGTLLLVGVVSSVTVRRRRRQQLAKLFENPGTVGAARAANLAHDGRRPWTFGN